MGLEADASFLCETPEHRHLPLERLHGVHGGPLERGVRLGHVLAHAGGHLGHPSQPELARHLPDPPRRLDDAGDVLVGLRREPHDEVHLHPVVAALEDTPGGGADVLVRDVLVDHVAHALRPGLRREGQAVDAHLLDLVEEVIAQAIGAQARDPQLDLARGELGDEGLDERIDAGDVRRAQRRQARGIKPRGIDSLQHRLDDFLGAALSYRAVDHPRLAKTAALGAPAGHLHRGPVKDGFDVGQREFGGERVLVEVANEDSLHTLRRVRGHPCLRASNHHHHPGARIEGARVK